MDSKKMFEERKQLEEQLKSIDLELSRLPSKHMYCCKNGKHFKWYESDGKNEKYIPKKRRAYAEKLAKKKYLTLKKEDLQKELTAIDFYLRHHDSAGGRAEELLADDSGYKELLTPYFKPVSKKLLEWSQSPYERCELFPEYLVHKTNAGIYVRSKSEASIVSFLHLKKIPFRYECLLQLGETPYYPDFTIRHPQTGKMYYWEHFGMMDVPEYYKGAFNKLQTYASFGIVPGINLITTFETKKNPLDVEWVKLLIEYYFD